MWETKSVKHKTEIEQEREWAEAVGAFVAASLFCGVAIWLSWRLFHRWEAVLLTWIIVGYQITIIQKLK